MGEERRITDLTSISAFRSNDYIAVDNASEAQTKKLPASVITDEFSVIENVYGAKNLIPYPYNHTTRTVNGITFTDNGDGTVSASGTATDLAVFQITPYHVETDNVNPKIPTNGDSVLLNGCPSGGKIGDTTYFYIQLSESVGSAVWSKNVSDFGEGARLTPLQNPMSIYVIRIVINQGTVISTPITFKPMLRLASIQDDTWVPYAKTNKELTDDVNEIEEDLENTMDLIRGDNDEYSSLKSYKVGQYVVVKPPLVPKETIYKCISPCSPGSWAINQSHFQSKTLTEAVTDLNNELSHVGMIIQSTTLDTEAKVKAIYGSNTSWIQHSGYVLRGATSGVVANSNVKTGGSDDAVVVSHNHAPTGGTHFVLSGGASQGIGGGASLTGSSGFSTGTAYRGESGTNKNIPNYKSVYIWERTA